MSKINQIEQALRQIGTAEFQKLADAYIHKKGYTNINPLGSVTGANKTRAGTPDTFVRLDNGKLVFIEHTTEQNNLFGKLEGDLEECLDESKTGVSTSEIQEIVLCHNSTLLPGNEQILYKKCQDHEIKLTIFGMGGIAFDLYQKYPGLANEFLGVTVDSGQILEPDDFITSYARNPLTTPLDNEFYFRENEIKELLENLENNTFVILSGPAGVGKSRLALEVLRSFKETHSDFEIHCIHNRGSDLYNDLRAYFSESGKFLILIDDANRTTQFTYFVDLLQNQRDDQQIKAIATVRDYARSKIYSMAKQLGTPPEVSIKLMSNEQIQSLVEKIFDIKNGDFQRRIIRIAGGNPRLAIMAAKIAIEHQTLQSIQNVSSLYDEYFASIRDDLEDLRDENVLKVAGIISFFRSVDRSNKELMRIIDEVFRISADDFWASAIRLHDCEAVDLWEDEVVKIGDQVFSTYLFHLCFFKEKIIDFSVLIDNFFPRQVNRLRDAIYPCLNSFYFVELTAAMSPHIQKTWEKLIKEENMDDLYQLIEMFWFMLQTEALDHINDYISTLDPCLEGVSNIDWSNENADKRSILSLLGLYKQTDNEDNFRIALELAYRYVEKRPLEAPKLLNLLKETFGFDHKSDNRGYIIQTIVIETLWDKTRSGIDELFSQIFLRVVKGYLNTHYMGNEAFGRGLTIFKFDLLPVKEIFELRKVIWEGIFKLYKAGYEEESLNVLKYYNSSGFHMENKQILVEDSRHLLPFMRNNLNPDDFNNCVLVHSYLSFLETYEILPDEKVEISEKFSNSKYALYRLLSLNYFDKRDLTTVEEFDHYKKQELEEYTREFNLEDYIALFTRCAEILPYIEDDHDTYIVNSALIRILLILFEKDSHLFGNVVEECLQSADLLQLNQPQILVDKLIKVYGPKETLKIIEGATIPEKHSWIMGYYMALPQNDIGPNAIEGLHRIYRESKCHELPWHFDFLLSYYRHDDSVIVNITNIILEKHANETDCISRLEMMFNPLTEINKNIIDIFRGNLDVLEKAYLIVSAKNKNVDFDGTTLGKILIANPDFITTYLDSIYADGKWPQRYDYARDYSFLWKLENCDFLMSHAIDRILKYESERGDIIGDYLERLFCIDRNQECSSEVVEKQDQFLVNLIELEFGNLELMKLLFGPISHFEENRRRRFIALFLEHNKNFDDFVHLELEPDSWGYSGSAVPMIQKRIDYWESLLPLCNTLQLLKHKLHIEKRISGLQSWMESEKKSDFMEDKF